MILTREEFEDCISSTSNYKRQLMLDHDIELRARLEAVEADYHAAQHLADATSKDWQLCKQQLTAAREQVARLEHEV